MILQKYSLNAAILLTFVLTHAELTSTDSSIIVTELTAQKYVYNNTVAKQHRVSSTTEEDIKDESVRCGFRNGNGVGLNTSSMKDNEAQYGEFNWIVVILKEERKLHGIVTEYHCSGTLIHPSVVLTTADCVVVSAENDTATIIVRTGEWNTKTRKELFAHQDRIVTEIIIHSDYDSKKSANNIALLLLHKPFDLMGTINIICLPAVTETFDNEQNCITTNWQKTDAILQRSELSVISTDQCAKDMGQKFNVKNNNVICGVGHTACKGDIGAPLICSVKGMTTRYYQLGMKISNNNCDKLTPGVYLNIPLYRNWIDQQLKLKNIHGKYYEF